MFAFQQDTNNAVEWYTDRVRTKERLALRIAEHACRSVVGVRLYRKAANWLSHRLHDRNDK